MNGIAIARETRARGNTELSGRRRPPARPRARSTGPRTSCRPRDQPRYHVGPSLPVRTEAASTSSGVRQGMTSSTCRPPIRASSQGDPDLIEQHEDRDDKDEGCRRGPPESARGRTRSRLPAERQKERCSTRPVDRHPLDESTSGDLLFREQHPRGRRPLTSHDRPNPRVAANSPDRSRALSAHRMFRAIKMSAPPEDPGAPIAASKICRPCP